MSVVDINCFQVTTKRRSIHIGASLILIPCWHMGCQSVIGPGILNHQIEYGCHCDCMQNILFWFKLTHRCQRYLWSRRTHSKQTQIKISSDIYTISSYFHKEKKWLSLFLVLYSNFFYSVFFFFLLETLSYQRYLNSWTFYQLYIYKRNQNLDLQINHHHHTVLCI